MRCHVGEAVQYAARFGQVIVAGRTPGPIFAVKGRQSVMSEGIVKVPPPVIKGPEQCWPPIITAARRRCNVEGARLCPALLHVPQDAEQARHDNGPPEGVGPHSPPVKSFLEPV